MGTHLKVLSESFPMNTNMKGFKHLCVLVLWMKVVSALDGLTLGHGGTLVLTWAPEVTSTTHFLYANGDGLLFSS